MTQSCTDRRIYCCTSRKIHLHKGKTKRTVMVKEESYLRFRALTLWLVREAKMQRPTFDDVFKLGLEAYLEKEPAAREYVEQACGKVQNSD